MGAGLFSFLVAFAVASVLAPAEAGSAVECVDGVTASGGICGTDTADVHVSVEGGWAISVSSAGTLGVDVSPTNSGTLSTVVDNVNVYTNIPTGYQLYLNSTSGSTNIYNASDTEQSQNHFVETSGTKATPAELAGDTWGYSLDTTPTTFAKVALTSEDTDSNIYTANTKSSSDGDDIPVTYGFMADTKLQPGTYSTSVTYTAIADAPAYTITSISPSTLQQDDQTNKTVTIMTSTPVTELAFGEVSARIGTVDLTNCTEITSDGFRGATCTYSGSLTPGYYTVELTSTWHNAAYAKANAFVIMSYLTVSGGTGSGWYAPGTAVPISASACATNYRFNNWTTNGGTIANANAASTTITTTTSNITVTRNCIINPYLTVSGGTGSGYYTPNSTINISASACSSGYTFSNWTTTGGTLGNANASSTTIKIASANVTVTRNCKVNNISGISTMQQMTSAICSATSSGTSKTLTDTRDNNSYRITKLPDGYCWMTQNMKYATSGSVANKSGYDGRLYTWSQATSTCPSGWVLPPNSGARSYQNLFNGRVTNYSGAEASPYYFTRAGYYYGSSYDSQGTYGYYWSSTARDSSVAYVFYYSTSLFAPQNYNGKTLYYSVRCVFGS